MCVAQILQRGQEVSEAGQSRSKWRVVRVAIVKLESMVYIGRLFFGDAETGDVVWDCDVRPSDGAADWLNPSLDDGVSAHLVQLVCALCHAVAVACSPGFRTDKTDQPVITVLCAR